MARKNWIASAIRHPGALTRQARRAGESVGEFAASHRSAKGVTGRRARLALTLRSMNRKRS